MSTSIRAAVLACLPRTRENWLRVSAELDVEHEPQLQPGYLGKGLTWCNEAVRRFCSLFGVELPKGMLVTEKAPKQGLLAWLDSRAGGIAQGWLACTEAEAVLHAQAGELVIVGWGALPHGHIAMLHPDSDTFALWILQAGTFNSSRCKLEKGFGSRPVKFWRHP